MNKIKSNAKKISEEIMIKYQTMFGETFFNVTSEEKVIGGVKCLKFNFNNHFVNKIGQFLIMIETMELPKRYFVFEFSYSGDCCVCEWVFDGKKNIGHKNFGIFFPAVKILEENLIENIIEKILKKG